MYTVRQLLAEAIGTFFLCFAGIGAIVATQAPVNSGADLLCIALAHGLALSIAVSIFAGISGAHFNPAVTIGFLTTGRISVPLAAMYVIAQLIGATVAAAACNFIFPEAAVNAAKLGIPLPPPGDWVTVQILLVTEFILTFLLMTAIFGTAVDERAAPMKLGGFAIGLTVAFDILCGGPVTGASMNPARSFGPALVHNHFDLHQWYWVAPIAGAVVAALLYHHVLLEPAEDELKR
jgi:MIP family channel proteins